MKTFKEFLYETRRGLPAVRDGQSDVTASEKVVAEINEYLQSQDKKMRAYCSTTTLVKAHHSDLYYTSVHLSWRTDNELDALVDDGDDTKELRDRFEKIKTKKAQTLVNAVKHVFEIAFKDPNFFGILAMRRSHQDLGTTLERDVRIREMPDDGWYGAARSDGKFNLALFWKP